MNQKSADDNHTPLEEMLENLPEQASPADLEQKCLDALDVLQAAEQPTDKPTPATRPNRLLWQGLAAAAAAVLVVSLISVWLPMGRQKRVAMSHERRPRSYAMEFPPGDIAPEERIADGAEPAAAPAPGDYGIEAEKVKMMDSQPEPPAAPAPVTTALPDEELRAGRTYNLEIELAEQTPESALRRYGTGDHATRGYNAQLNIPELEAVDQVSRYPSVPVIGESYSRWETATTPTRPWRDDSGERQKIARKELELAVQDVEEAYDEAVSIIEKAGGYVDTENITVEESGDKQALISARVPVDQLDDVVAGLRKLGEVISLVGESEDRTKEYDGRGAEIRDLGAEECELVAKYEQEKNKARKRELYRRIIALREQNSRYKATLKDLSDRTHFAYLELILVEKLSPRAFLNDIVENMAFLGSWIGATAVFWVPALIIILAVWRRKGAAVTS